MAEVCGKVDSKVVGDFFSDVLSLAGSGSPANSGADHVRDLSQGEIVEEFGEDLHRVVNEVSSSASARGGTSRWRTSRWRTATTATVRRGASGGRSPSAGRHAASFPVPQLVPHGAGDLHGFFLRHSFSVADLGHEL